MEKLIFSYSLKNIPTADEKSYKLRLLEKIDIIIKKCVGEPSFLQTTIKKLLKITKKVLVMIWREVEVLHS